MNEENKFFETVFGKDADPFKQFVEKPNNIDYFSEFDKYKADKFNKDYGESKVKKKPKNKKPRTVTVWKRTWFSQLTMI